MQLNQAFDHLCAVKFVVFLCEGNIIIGTTCYDCPMWTCVIKKETVCFSDSAVSSREGLLQTVGDGKAGSTLYTQPNLLQAWQGTLWDAGCDSTGRIKWLNINQRRRREEVKPSRSR